MLPAVKSLLTHSSVDRVYLLVEDLPFPYELPERVTALNVSGFRAFDPQGPNYNCKWTYMVLMKTALPILFGQHDRMLCLDIDTIVMRNPDAIFDVDLDGYYLAAVHDTARPADPEYINAGVMYMNLEAMRQDKKDVELIQTLNTRKYTFCEQEAIHEFCHGRILRLPGEWNVSNWTDRPNQAPIIRHFAAEKDWFNDPLVQEWDAKPWPDGGR